MPVRPADEKRGEIGAAVAPLCDLFRKSLTCETVPALIENNTAVETANPGQESFGFGVTALGSVAVFCLIELAQPGLANPDRGASSINAFEKTVDKFGLG